MPMLSYFKPNPSYQILIYLCFSITIIIFTACGSGSSSDKKKDKEPDENQSIAVTISSPKNNDVFDIGALVHFEGDAKDAANNNLPDDLLKWASDIDGEIGTGNSFSKDNLKAGHHTITLKATDLNGNQKQATLTITIKQKEVYPPPVATIISPENLSTFHKDTSVAFKGKATEYNGNELSGDALKWVSDLDGEIGKGTLVESKILQSGRHVIQLIATDSLGQTAATEIQLTISKTEVSITEPMNKSTFLIHSMIQFTGTGKDLMGKDLKESNLIWSSSIDQQIGIGRTFTTNTLSKGIHLITLTGTDDAGNKNSKTITITCKVAKAEWLNLYDFNGDEKVSSMTLGTDNHIYLSGNTTQNGGDGILLKLDSNGQKQFEKKTGGAYLDAIYNLGINSKGEIYNTGVSQYDQNSFNELFINRRNETGQLLNHESFFSVSHSPVIKKARGIAMDAKDNIYLAAMDMFGKSEETNKHISVTKFDSTDTQQWRYYFGNSDSEIVNDITTDQAGNIYLTGYTKGDLDGNHAGNINPSIYVLKLNENGQKEWIFQMDSSGDDEGIKLIVEESGLIHVIGSTLNGINGLGTKGGLDSFVLTLKKNGVMNQFFQIGSPADDIAHSIIFDNYGSYYISGKTNGNLNGAINAGGSDVFITRYAPNGSHEWTELFGGALNEEIAGIALDQMGYCYMAGSSQTGFLNQKTAMGEDIFVLKLQVELK